MKTIRFLAAARRELLAEVLHYNEVEVGLGGKFARDFEARIGCVTNGNHPAKRGIRGVHSTDAVGFAHPSYGNLQLAGAYR